MDMIVDFILLAASGAATIYCFVLSRRLAKLNDMKNGIGASIASMSSALDQTQQVLAFAKSSSLEGVKRLTEVLEEAERVKPEITQLLEVLSELADIASDDIDAARANALRQIDARMRAQEPDRRSAAVVRAKSGKAA
jgi:ABC-type transporter Mla subunit MlaD